MVEWILIFLVFFTGSLTVYDISRRKKFSAMLVILFVVMIVSTYSWGVYKALEKMPPNSSSEEIQDVLD